MMSQVCAPSARWPLAQEVVGDAFGVQVLLLDEL